jgi:tetratricopeptide (TPR) repeat protein
MGKKDFEASEAILRETLALRRKSLGNRHPRVATTTLQLGRVLMMRGRADQAEPFLRETVAIREEVLAPDNWYIAYAQVELGICLMHLGRYAEAESLIRPHYDRMKTQLGEAHIRVQQASDTLAYLNTVSGKPMPAEIF